jgi:tetratricopeptide (TPR) repeat protein
MQHRRGVMSQAISKTRLHVFRILMLSFPLLFFALLESGLRYFDYGEELALFVPVAEGHADADYLQVNPAVAKRYFSRVGRTPRPAHELFLKEKPANSYRIFVMGGSTAAGWPYPNNAMFSRILKQRLSDVFPNRHLEIINTGIAAVNSFTLLDFIDEIVAQQPDAILIYAGHNEFYGALGAASSESLGQSRWLVNTYLSLLHFKTVQGLRDLFITLGQWLNVETIDFSGYPTLMGRMIGEQSVPYNDAVYRRARAHYRENMHDILQRAHEVGVPVVVSELVSNVRDQAPFISVETEGYPQADAVYEHARQLEDEGEYDLARTAYYRAKDLDALRFRATEEFNEVIHQVAATFEVPVVPMKRYFEQASPNGLIGNNLMLEHLHPKVEGYHLLAEAFFDSLREHRFISDHWDESRIRPAAFYAARWPVSELDRAIGHLRVIHLMDNWPFSPLDAPGNAFERYQPSNQVETLAYKVVQRQMSFKQAHVELAMHYTANEKRGLALREYRALISAAPYDAAQYLIAAKGMLDAREFDAALTMLHRSLKLKNSAIANKWIGQVLMQQRRSQEALAYLEAATGGRPNDPHLHFMIGAAYVFGNQQQKAREKLSQLSALSPNFPGIAELQRMIEARWPQQDEG